MLSVLCADQVMYEPFMLHAGMLLSMAWQASIVTAFVDLMQQPDSAQARNALLAAADADKAAGGAEGVCAQGTSVPSCAAAAAAAGSALGAESRSADGVAVVRVVPVAEAAGGSAGEVEKPGHCCQHQYSRMYSDCLASSLRAQQQEGSAVEQAQQQGAAGLRHRALHASAAKQQQKRQLEIAAVAVSPAAAGVTTVQPACC
jgi:hypothetical protein